MSESHPAASIALVDAICFVLSQRLRRMTKRLDKLVAPAARRSSGPLEKPQQPRKKESPLVAAWNRLLRPNKPRNRS